MITAVSWKLASPYRISHAIFIEENWALIMPEGDIDVFISYKKEEADKAQRLLEALEVAGYSAVYDATGLNLNENFADKLESLIRRARKVVVLWTEMSASSDWVRDEARLARDLDKYLGVVVEPNSDIALDLRNLHKIDLTRMDFDAGVDVIVNEIADQLGLGSLTPVVLAETSFFRAVEAGGTRGGYEAFLGAHPSGRYSEQARRGLAALPRWRTVPITAAILGAALMGVGGYFTAGYLGSSSPNADQLVTMQNDLQAAVAAHAAGKAQIESLSQQIAELKRVAEFYENSDSSKAELERLSQKLNAALASKARTLDTQQAQRIASSTGVKARPNCRTKGENGVKILDECYPLSTVILRLTDPEIVDASPLTALTSLKRLFLEGTQIADATPLSGLISLTTLDLAGTQVADAKPLARLTLLKRISLKGTNITDLRQLRRLTSLHFLGAPDGDLIGEYYRDSPENRKAVADYIAANSR